MTSKFEPFLIAQYRSGIDQSQDPWLIPQDAYESILDGFAYKGVVNKREGYSWFDSVPHAIDPLVYQNVTNITNGPNSQVTTVNAHGLANGDIIRLTDVLGFTTPVPGENINGTRWTITVIGPNDFTINNNFVYIGAYTPGTGTVSTFPGLPIMAIANWIDDFGNGNLMVLDIRRASIYDTSPAQECLKPIGTVNQFSGNDANYFWYENYKVGGPIGSAKIYFTNNVDNIFYWDATIPLANGLSTMVPNPSPGITVDRCLMIKALSNRLVLFNTTETDVSTDSFFNRARFCAEAIDPTQTVGPPNAWDDITPGLGGFIDTSDSIYLMSLGQIQYNVYVFGRGNIFGSIYEFRANQSNPESPFNWIKIADARNVNATFGTFVIDRQITAIGNTGFITTDGTTVGRFDQKIPEFAYSIDQNNFGRCYAYRNDITWQSWLLYPDVDSTPDGKNNRALIFNYLDGSWQVYRFDAVNPDLRMAVLGSFTNPLPDPTWIAYDGTTFPDWNWIDFGEETWNSIGIQADAPILLGGDYSGNVWKMDSGGGDAADNVVYADPPLVDDGTPIQFELLTRQWFPYGNTGIASQFGYVDFLIDAQPNTVPLVEFTIENDSAPYKTVAFSCVPQENMIVANITNIDQAVIATVTAPNHGLISGQTIFIYDVQGMIEINDLSYIVTVVNANQFTIPVNTTAFNAYIVGGFVSLAPIIETVFLRRVWSGQTGVFHQMKIVSSGVDEDFRLHAMLCWFKKTGRIYK